MLISVAVCTHQRYGALGDALRPLLGQALPAEAFEVLVIDNSPDAGRSQAEAAAWASHGNLRWLHAAPPGLARARNRAVAEAAAPLIAFIDDDVEVAPGWLGALVAGFERFGAAAVCAGGPVRPLWPAPRPAWVAEGMLPYLSLVDHGVVARVLAPAEWVAGANVAYRREALRAAGGFREDLGRSGSDVVLLSNEETELAERLRAQGGATAWLPEAAVHHRIGPERLEQRWFRRRAAWQAVSDFRLHPEHHAREILPAWREAASYLAHFAGVPAQQALAMDHASPDLAHWQVSAIYHLMLGLLGGLREPPA